MPDSNGKLQLQDYDAALVVRGFDNFQQSDRYQMINFGYRQIARKFPYTWQESSSQYVVAPGTFVIDVSGMTPLTPQSIEYVTCITDPYRLKLETISQHRFVEKWLDLDLTNPMNQGITAQYIVYQNLIYLLPPPQVQVTFQVYFKKYLADLKLITDTTVMPMVFDEIILDAALVRAHRRAHELTLAADAQARVDDGIEDLLRNDVFQSEELQERVIPDDQWW